MRSILIFLIFLLFPIKNFIFSQTPPYYHYTSIDGLASSTVYDILQDSKGFIWCATNNGISRFDGHRFKNYGAKEGLNSNIITGLAEGNKGELYIANYEKGINVLNEGNVINYSKSEKKSAFINYIFFEQNKLFGYGYYDLILYSNGMNENIFNFTLLKDINNNRILLYKICKLANGKFLASTSDGLYIIKNRELKKINIEGFQNTEIFCAFEDKYGNLYAGSMGKIYQIRNFKIVKVFKTKYIDNKVNSIMADSRGNIWFSIMNKGFYVIKKDSDNIFDFGSKLKITKAVINDFLEDIEGNIWVSTLGKGIFCLNNLYLTNYSEDDGLSNNSVQSIIIDNKGNILLGTSNGINILDNGEIKVLKIGENDFLTDYIHCMSLVDDTVYVCTSTTNGDVINRFYQNLEFIFFNGISFCKTKDENYIIGTGVNITYTGSNIFNAINVNERINNTIIGDENKINRINKIFEDSQKNLWIGTSLGLCKLKNSEKFYFVDNEILNFSIKSIIQDNNSNIWFAGEKGIAFYNIQDSNITNYKNISDFDLSYSNTLVIDKDNRLWIGNKKGLYLLEKNSIKLINTSQGLPSDEVLSLYYDKEKNIMWIGTSNGFSSLDINNYDLNKIQTLNIQIDKIKAGDSIYTKYYDLDFENSVNDIQINFNVINFSSPSNLKYQYKLNGDWINTDNDFIDFKSLKYGKYDVTFRAKTQNGEWSKPYYLSFSIKPKFFETILFKLLIFVFITGIIITASKYKINHDRKKREVKSENFKKMHELEHQALSAMMNPHFIFNSLNSVQYLVNKGRNDEANDYISILAKLIRKNLDTAGDSYIQLDEEISRLTYYLEIEKLRFQDKFYYEIIAGEDVDIESVLIPNMILQPFVENAVWYGIMNMGKKGFVKISFRFENVNIDSNTHRCLVIKIKDNGIGIKNSGAIKKEGHISKGIKIIEERLKLLSHELEIPTPLIIEDLSLRNENSTGTEVIITLPDTLFRIII